MLDGILDNHNDLSIEEHTTDTAGYTDLVFVLFELLGLRLSPRVRDIADHWIWRIGSLDHHQNAGQLVTSQIRTERIADHWDDMLRVAGPPTTDGPQHRYSSQNFSPQRPATQPPKPSKNTDG